MRLLVFSLLLISLSACNDSPKIPENFDYGKVENGVYKNDFFNFELPIPADWAVQDKEQMQQIKEEGRKIVSEHNEKLGEQIKASDVSTAMLLSVFQYKEDSVVGNFNPSFGIAVEKIVRASGVNNSEGYLKKAKTIMQQSGIPYRFPGSIISQKLGNRNFSVMETIATYKGTIEVGQLYYVILDKGFAISIIASFGNDEQRERLRQILGNIRYK